MSETKQKALLEVRGLKQYFEIDRRHTVKAVDNVSFILSCRNTCNLAFQFSAWARVSVAIMKSSAYRTR